MGGDADWRRKGTSAIDALNPQPRGERLTSASWIVVVDSVKKTSLRLVRYISVYNV